MIRLKSLLEQIEFDFPNDDITNKPGYGNTAYADLNKTPYKDYNIYNVFISGIESDISSAAQASAFKKGYPPQTNAKNEVILETFSKYDIPGITKFFKNPPGTIGKIVLFSAGCNLADMIINLLGPAYAGKIYCVEPYASDTNKSNWTSIPAGNFYVHPTSWHRGAGATDGSMNFTPAKQGHLANLTWAVQQIFS